MVPVANRRIQSISTSVQLVVIGGVQCMPCALNGLGQTRVGAELSRCTELMRIPSNAGHAKSRQGSRGAQYVGFESPFLNCSALVRLRIRLRLELINSSKKKYVTYSIMFLKWSRLLNSHNAICNRLHHPRGGIDVGEVDGSHRVHLRRTPV